MQLSLAQAEDSTSALERFLRSLQLALANAMTRAALMLTGLRFGVSTAFDAVPIFTGRKFHMHAAFENKGKQIPEWITLSAATRLVPSDRL